MRAQSGGEREISKGESENKGGREGGGVLKECFEMWKRDTAQL